MMIFKLDENLNNSSRLSKKTNKNVNLTQKVYTNSLGLNKIPNIYSDLSLDSRVILGNGRFSIVF